MTSADALADVVLVGIGGDIGVYAIVRAAHEAYGLTAVVLSMVDSQVTGDSAIVQQIVEPGLTDPAVMLGALGRIANQHAGRTLVLFTNADWVVWLLAEHRAAIEALGYRVAVPDEAVIEQVSDKVGFAQLCDQVGISTPRSVAVSVGELADDPRGVQSAAGALSVPFAGPFIAKPATSAEYDLLHMPGKRKIYFLDTRAEVNEVLVALAEAGYRATFLVQEFVPGGETALRSLTAYRDRSGEVTLLAGGIVLLQEHTPDLLGVPAAILTEDMPDAFDAAVRFLDAANYHGFANFDVKVDPRDGRMVFFEVNTRIGRNNYYVTAGGANVAVALLNDLVLHTPATQVRARAGVLYSVVPYRLLLRYLAPGPLRQRVRAARRAMVHPLRYRADGQLARRARVELRTANFWRKYHRYYPHATETGY